MARRSDTSPAGLLVAGLVVLGLVLLVLEWLLITAAILAVPFGIWRVWDHAAQDHARQNAEALAAHRREVESRAVIDPTGGCGWCGVPTGHRDHRTGARVTPRAYHHHETEQTLDARPT